MKKTIILALALITGNLFCLQAQNNLDLGEPSNRWSVRTSSNGAQEFYIVPMGSSWWDWSTATIFKTNGDIVARRNLSVNGGKVFTKGITGTSTEKLLLEGYSYQGTQHGVLLRAPEEGINFETYDAGAWRSRMHIADNGNIGIGTVNTTDYKLAVKGKIIAEELKVALHTNWPDYVFKNNYNLPSLVEVENHIKEKGHLKDIPSEKEVKENGIMVGEMNAMLLRKIEELTLYVIKQQKQIDILNAERLKEKK